MHGTGICQRRKMQDVIQQIVGRHNRVVNLSNPIVDTRLADGSRVNIVLAPVSLDGSTITIRKFPEKPQDMQTLIQKGALPEDAAEFLKMLVRAKYNLLISGGTSSGKTTFLNALSQYIPEDERVITIEDSAELQIQWEQKSGTFRNTECKYGGRPAGNNPGSDPHGIAYASGQNTRWGVPWSGGI